MEIKSQLVSLAVKDIEIPAGGNPRRDMGQLFDLSDSINRVTQLAPIIINRVGDKNILVAGERRVRAAIEAEMPFIEAKVFENLDAETSLLMTLAENKYKPLDPIEEARGYQMLIETCGYNIKKVAKECNVTPETVDRRLKLLELPDEVQMAIKREENKLPVHQAVEIARLKDKTKQIQAARAIAPSTGPVMTEAQAKQYIEENFKTKQPKLDIDHADPADKMPTLPRPEKSDKTEKVETTRSLGDGQPVAARISGMGQLYVTTKGVAEILNVNIALEVGLDRVELKFDNIILPGSKSANMVLAELVKKHQLKPKTKRSEKLTIGDLCPNPKCPGKKNKPAEDKKSKGKKKDK